MIWLIEIEFPKGCWIQLAIMEGTRNDVECLIRKWKNQNRVLGNPFRFSILPEDV